MFSIMAAPLYILPGSVGGFLKDVFCTCWPCTLVVTHGVCNYFTALLRENGSAHSLSEEKAL